MFKCDGLHITTQGYFYARWDKDAETHVGKPLKLEEIETHLGSMLTLAPDVRLKHVFMPILNSDFFATLFKRNFWGDIREEILTVPWKEWEGDTLPAEALNSSYIEYVEVYETLEYGEQENEMQNIAGRHNFHGISYPVRTVGEEEGIFQKVGERVPYSISESSMTEYMNHPVCVGRSSFTKHTPKGYETIFERSKFYVTLFGFLDSILYDMSFYGGRTNREKMRAELEAAIHDIGLP